MSESDLAELFEIGRFAFEPDILLEAYRKKLCLRTYGGVTRIMFGARPSPELRRAIASQLKGFWAEISHTEWIASETNENARRSVNGMIAAGFYLARVCLTQSVPMGLAEVTN